jgi:hypothetical protein
MVHTNFTLEHMSRKSNMNAHSARIASRIRMRLSGIKIPCTSAATAGLAVLSMDPRMHSTPAQYVRAKQTHAATVARSSPAPGHHSATKAEVQRRRIGRRDWFILKKRTSSETAITRRSSFVRITFASI